MGVRTEAGREANVARTGRPRDAEADRAILEATLALVTTRGYEGLRINDVAERAGVAKTTMYRRWPTKSDLLMAALETSPPLPDVDTGDLKADLTTLMQRFLDATDGMPLVELLASLAAERQRDPKLARTLDPFVQARSEPVTRAFQRAIARGEIPATTDVTLATHLLGGAVVVRLLFGGGVQERTLDSISMMVVAAARNPD